MTSEKYEFKAQTNQVLDLLTNSVYSNRDVFLKELISNASDALQKAKLESLQDTDYLKEGEELKIQIVTDEENNQIIIKDNGIGMNKEGLKENIGTIAQSGTKKFLEKLKKEKKEDDNLIGKFGIGFYSVFMVADKVEVNTKTQNDKGYKWTSKGKDKYEIKETDKKQRGTEIIVHLKKDADDFADENKIKSLIKKYSNYVSFPIELLVTEEINETEDEGGEDNETTKTEEKFKQINETQSIWSKKSGNVDKEEYIEFYRTLSNDYNEPLGWLHNSIEGMLNYKSLLYIPSKAQMSIKDPNQDYGPKLYIQNVLVLDNAKQLLPKWLRFVEGVVETKDLDMNISREMLQDNRTITKIKNSLTKKLIKKLTSLGKQEPSKYNVFLQDYGKILKEGIHYDRARKDEIAGLLKFYSVQEDQKIFLDEYIENMEEDQEEIYYLIGDSIEQMKNSPYLNKFQNNNKDVLLLDEPIDNWVVQGLMEYKGKALVSIQSEQANNDESEESNEDEENNDFLEFVKEKIGEDKLANVKMTGGIQDTPALLVRKQGAPSPQMQQLMQNMNQFAPNVKKVFKLNKNSNIVKNMKKEFTSNSDSPKLEKMIDYLYKQAILNEGGQIDDMSGFLKLVNEFAEKYVD